MRPENTTVVVTTVNPPTECMHTLAGRVQEFQLKWIVVGDRKGPAEFSLPPAELITIEQQRVLPFQLAKLLPEKHYARKNLGYLLAMARGCERLYETDDDNAPIEGWHLRDRVTEGRRIEPMTDAHWVNIYEAFTVEQIWPRGLPLNQIRRHFADDFAVAENPVRVVAPIQQGLA